jgi:hypothetical protein
MWEFWVCQYWKWRMGGCRDGIVTVYVRECTLTTDNPMSTYSRIFKIGSTNYKYYISCSPLRFWLNYAVLVFLNNLWGARNRVGIGLSFRPARLHTIQ